VNLGAQAQAHASRASALIDRRLRGALAQASATHSDKEGVAHDPTELKEVSA
jgi:hypothetical protein